MTKHPALLPLTFVTLLFIASCTSEDKGAVSSEALTGVPFARTSGLDTTLIVIQETTNHMAVKSKMEETADEWKEKGVQRHEMYVSSTGNNKVITFMALNDFEKAKALIEDKSQLNTLDIEGGESGVEVMMLDQELEYTQETNDTVLFFMSFKTMDYNRWEKAFLDDFVEDPSKDFEVLKVFRGVDEPNEVFMFFLVNDPEYVQKMEKDNSFRMKMLASGVVSYPVTYMLEPDSI